MLADRGVSRSGTTVRTCGLGRWKVRYQTIATTPILTVFGNDDNDYKDDDISNNNNNNYYYYYNININCVF